MDLVSSGWQEALPAMVPQSPPNGVLVVWRHLIHELSHLLVKLLLDGSHHEPAERKQ